MIGNPARNKTVVDEGGAGHILVIDDEPQLLQLMQRMLGRAGHRCKLARSVQDAMALLGEHDHIEVVVSDIRMPGLNGLQLLSLIRERFPDRPWLEVVLMTGDPTTDTAIQALREGARDFLVKPFGQNELTGTLAKALDRARRRRIVHQQQMATGEFLQRFGAEANQLFSMLLPDIARPKIASLEEQTADLASNQDIPNPSKAALVTPARVDRLLKWHRARSRYFPEKALSELGWAMLLDLFHAHITGDFICISDLCATAGVPNTTALRRIDELEGAGLLTRHTDPRDKRRTRVLLSEKAREQMTRYLEVILTDACQELAA